MDYDEFEKECAYLDKYFFKYNIEHDGEYCKYIKNVVKLMEKEEKFSLFKLLTGTSLSQNFRLKVRDFQSVVTFENFYLMHDHMQNQKKLNKEQISLNESIETKIKSLADENHENC